MQPLFYADVVTVEIAAVQRALREARIEYSIGIVLTLNRCVVGATAIVMDQP